MNTCAWLCAYAHKYENAYTYTRTHIHTCHDTIAHHGVSCRIQGLSHHWRHTTETMPRLLAIRCSNTRMCVNVCARTHEYVQICKQMLQSFVIRSCECVCVCACECEPCVCNDSYVCMFLYMHNCLLLQKDTYIHIYIIYNTWTPKYRQLAYIRPPLLRLLL